MSTPRIPPIYSVFNAEAIEIPSCASQQSEVLEEEDHNEFLLRSSTLQEIFLRISWRHKMGLLKKLLRGMNNIETITLLLYGLQCVIDGKSIVYCEVITDSSYIYDKPVRDHDRAVDSKTYEESEEDEVVWFQKLPSENQLKLIGELPNVEPDPDEEEEEDEHGPEENTKPDLIRISGGMIMRKIYPYVLKRYKEKLKQARLENAKPKEDQQKNLSGASVVEQAINKEMGETLEATQTVVQLRKQWQDKMDKFKQGMEGKAKEKKKAKKKLGEESEKPKKNKKSNKEKKSPSIKSKKSNAKEENVKKDKKDNKSKKGSKSRSKSKGSKGKKTKTEADYPLDYIQVLPIWLAMKVFSYLDDKTLRKIRSVHEYWEFISDLIIEDRKARKALDKVIKKLKAELDDEALDDDDNQEPEPFYKVSELDKRTNNILEKGASDKRILGKCHREQLEESSLQIKALREMRDQYTLPVQFLTTYPRKRPGPMPPVYQPPFCCLRDINLKLDHSERMQSFEKSHQFKAPPRNSGGSFTPENFCKGTYFNFQRADIDSW